MTYYESYKKLDTVEEIVAKAKQDAKRALLFLGGSPDRIKIIMEHMNKAVAEKEAENKDV